MFTAIIPFYNENTNILNVLSVVKKLKLVKQIICIDDGSTDNTSQLIKQQFTQVSLIISPKNEGKAEAVGKGLTQTKYENILLLDADLVGLRPKELSHALDIFQRNNTGSGQARMTKPVDMIILENRGDNFFIDHFLRKTIVQSGKRILKKADLLAIYKRPPHGYQLEVAINKYMIDQHKNVFWMKSSSRNPHVIEKRGWWVGLKRDLGMDSEIRAYVGWFTHLRQLLFFCPHEIS